MQPKAASLYHKSMRTLSSFDTHRRKLNFNRIKKNIPFSKTSLKSIYGRSHYKGRTFFCTKFRQEFQLKRQNYKTSLDMNCMIHLNQNNRSIDILFREKKFIFLVFMVQIKIKIYFCTHCSIIL